MTDALAPRDQITPGQLTTLATHRPVPIFLIGSADGYGVLVGEPHRRWLHNTSGQFRLFRSIDSATALLRRCGIHKFSIDVTGGTPQ